MVQADDYFNDPEMAQEIADNAADVAREKGSAAVAADLRELALIAEEGGHVALSELSSDLK